MPETELSDDPADRLPLRLLRTVVEELSVELKRGSFHSRSCDTICLLSGSLSAAAEQARQPPPAVATALRSLPTKMADAEVEVNLLDEFWEDKPSGQQEGRASYSDLYSNAVNTRGAYGDLHSNTANRRSAGMRSVKCSIISKSRESKCSVTSKSNTSKSKSRSTLSKSCSSLAESRVSSDLSYDDGDPCGVEAQMRKNQETLLEMFHQLDQDKNGTLSVEELRAALVAVGIPKARTRRIVGAADLDGTGEIDFSEWKAVVCDTNDPDIQVLYASLLKITEGNRLILQSVTRGEVTSSCMLRPDSGLRLTWDICLALLCVYVAVVLPFSSSFAVWIKDDVLYRIEKFELAVDLCFLFDVCLNFRTGIMRQNGDVIMDWRRVAASYASSWFALDLASSIPLSEIAPGNTTNVSVLKLLKIPKLLKAIRVIRSVLLSESQLVLSMKESFSTRFMRALSRRGTTVILTAFLCHWLACLMAFSSTDWLSEYFARLNQAERLFSVYLTALYWAMTCMTTVGWGDIVPKTDAERGYVLLAMVVGGTYYGYTVGSMAAVMTNRDLHESTYYDRMEALYHWIDHHKLPRDIRRRIVRYYSLGLSEKCAIDEAEVLNDLSPALLSELGALIVDSDILNNPLFDSVPMNAVTRLQAIVATIYIDEGNSVVGLGEAGMAMFIISEGTATQEFCPEALPRRRRARMLAEGDSFGEEIICSLADTYRYTVVVTSKRARMFVIEEEAFQKLFEHMPEVRDQVVKNVSKLDHVIIKG